MPLKEEETDIGTHLPRENMKKKKKKILKVI